MGTLSSLPDSLDPGLLDLTARVVFFPVRHHSPACARAVRRLALELRPSAILIEGPSDFNDRIDELYLPHRLPIAIYTFVRCSEMRWGAFYPFCVYSPEWQALQAARELGVPARFIDLPFAQMAGAELPAHLYADGELRASDYIDALCRRVGVEGFDALWDTLFEIEPDLPLVDLLERCHRFCFQTRALDRHVPAQDLRREAFITGQVRQALAELPGRILVVTGGFHSSAIYEALTGNAGPEAAPDPDTEDREALEMECGIALTPYSYERLDSLRGYDAGMPNPGFYHQVWEDRSAGRAGTHRRLLAQVVRELRRRGQRFSTADLIAVETTASALAALRGHQEVWRVDLIDGILGALVKDDLEQGVPHPFLEAVHAVFRGGERGRLAEGAELPPLVHDLRRLLSEHDLEPQPRERTLLLDLTAPPDRARSCVLHRLPGLGIPGYDRTGGTDLAAREDLTRFEEEWRIRWSPEFEAACIEAALYGPTLEEAVAARLRERAAATERDAEAGARLLLEARLMGLEELQPAFHARLVELIREDGRFLGVAGALGHLVYLYRYDEVLGAAGDAAIGSLLAEAWTRGLWLLESLGRPQEEGPALLDGIRALVHTYETLSAQPTREGEAPAEPASPFAIRHSPFAGPGELPRDELISVFRRIAGEDAQSPIMRGAATGALWSLGESDTDAVLAGMRFCSEPDRLGDYLAGLFALARETIQRHPELSVAIDGLLMAYGDEQFLEALPALRLAFSYFTPREKHYLARTLLQALGIEDAEPLDALEVGPEIAARALALEADVFQVLERYGLRRLLV